MTQRILQWLIFVAVSFLLLATVALLSGYPAPQAGKDFPYTILPNYLQAASTVFAAYVAWLVFKEWREPERARRRADQAPDLLRKLNTFTATLRAARFSHISFEFPLKGEWLLKALSERRAQRVNDFSDALLQLQQITDEVTDPAATVLLEQLAIQGRDFLIAWANVNDLKIDLVEEEDVPISEAEYPEYQHDLEILGFRHRKQRSNDLLDVYELAQRLRTLLRHHITLTDPSSH